MPQSHLGPGSCCGNFSLGLIIQGYKIIIIITDITINNVNVIIIGVVGVKWSLDNILFVIYTTSS